MDFSSILSFASFILYSITYFPQLQLIIHNKSVEGISVIMLCLWTQADFLALIATILLHLPLNLVLIDIYHIFIGLLTIYFVILYQASDEGKKQKLVWGFVVINILVVLIVSSLFITGGEIIAWITSIFYIGGRFPQIIKNNKLKSVEGLSKWMYILTILANICYLSSILVIGENLSVYLPWIILISSTVVLDFIVLYQFSLYGKSEVELLELENVSVSGDNVSGNNVNSNFAK